MTILLSGGGSGGHITPLLAVAAELKQLKPHVHIVFVGQRGDGLADIPAADKNIDEVFTVRAGKFRRYHGEGLKQLVDVPTVAKNVRDAGRVMVGLAESRRLLKKIKPDMIFIKGGFVGVPIGLAAGRLGIPYITHDSDAIPGLANRIIAKRAAAHAVALPKELYPYPKAKTFTVGVPITGEYQPVTQKLQQQYRQELKLEKFKQVVFVTGGGNGARMLNSAVVASSERLLETFPDAAIVHVAGRAFEAETQADYEAVLSPGALARVFVKGFLTDLYRYSGAADVVIARGSATNLAEFATQAKACVIIPGKLLLWTVRNAEGLVERHAAMVIAEDEALARPEVLVNACTELLQSPGLRQQLGEQLSATLSHPGAARELAQLLLKTVS